MKKLISALIFSACFQAHAQIPVTDVASLTQQVQQVAAWVQQLKAMKDQLTQAKQIADSLKGDRQLWNIVNAASDQQLRKTLPPEVVQIIEAAKSGSQQDGIFGDARKILTSLPPMIGPGQVEDATRRAAMAGQQAYGDAVYKSASQRIDALQQILSTAGQATDVKAISEIQVRMAFENALIQNELLKLQSLKMASEARERIASEKASATMNRFLYSAPKKPQLQ